MNLPKIKDIHIVLFLNDKIKLGIGKDYGIEIENLDEKYTQLIKLLDGQYTINEICSFVDSLSPNELEESISLLDTLGYLEDNFVTTTELTSEELDRYSVNLNFFNTLDTLSLTKYDYQLKLKKTRILLLGIGGIGSNICLALAELGIGHITAVDFDTVEASNLNRQILYSTSDIGKRKVEAAKESLRKFNPLIEFEVLDKEIGSKEDVDELIKTSKCDIVVNVADYPTGYIDFWVNEACVQYNKLCLSAVVGKKNGKVYSIIPYKAACYYCQFLEDLEKIPEYAEELETVRTMTNSLELEMFRTPNGALGPACLFQGYFISFEILRYIFWGYEALLTFNKRFSIDFITFEQHFDELTKYPTCSICGGKKE
ncbi:thiamine biosynthesis protein ThiF [Streptococcus pneumoniae]|nr:thiamine biosynthesis protein ThiF [Streptococcus pneumoniae]